MSHDIGMPGDYEFYSLHHGTTVQRQWNRNRLNLIEKLKFISKKDIVLDAGCGSGNAVLEFSNQAKKIEGWDINKKSIKFLNKKIREKGIKNASAKYNNLLSFKGKPKFSRIILTEVIEHFSHEDYGKMLKNLKSALLPKGRIFITTPNDRSIWPLLEYSLNIYQKKVQGIPTFEHRHLGHFHKDKLENIVDSLGFKIIKSGTMNAFSPFLFFVDENTRNRVSNWESENVSFGPLLYLVVEKQ